MQMPISAASGVTPTPAVSTAPKPSTAQQEPVASNSKPVETVTQQAVQAAKPKTTAEEVKDSVAKINKNIQMAATGLEFSVDEDTGINLVKVVDTQTKEVIRQIPSEEAIHIAKALDKLQGLLVRDKA